MSEIGVLAATGFLGSGFLPESLELGIDSGVDVIGCDAGSTDAGPFYLGSGESITGRTQYVRDLELMLKAHVRHGVPVIVGSAGGAGSNRQVDWTRELVQEIATRNGMRLDVAFIYTEVSRQYVHDKLSAGRVRPLRPEASLDAATIDQLSPIVSQIGAEPFAEAIKRGAGVVIAGRSCDAAIYAAIPIMKGASPGVAWHAGKIVECGAASAVHRTTPDCMKVVLRPAEFVVEPPNPALRCTPGSVATQSIYESSNPFQLVMPSGVLDLSSAQYEQRGERSVAASGAVFEPATVYTLKLEGVRLAGYRSSCVAGTEDPYILERLPEFLADVEGAVRKKIAAHYAGAIAEHDYKIVVHQFGTAVSSSSVADVGLLLEVIAPTQIMASEILGVLRLTLLHHPVPEWTGHVSNLALPHGLSSAQMGPAYEFAINHVVEVDDPLETVLIDNVSVRG